MNHRLWTGWVCLAAAILPLSAAAQTKPPTSPLALIERFEAARRDFAPAALASTLAPDFVEISPRGEVDSRDRVLGFYAPDRKQAAPPFERDDMTVRSLGDTALVSARLSLTLPGTNQRRAVRVLYVTHHGKAGWQLVSVQYTPIALPPAP
ncbi:nuclear transport factor 2 family protein [uncultured Sphingomonas sp.]|uniref:nuclear transport factor 2 family protein n=1 Tax=uncultured Sphingomonas sp. TaxID=158754 RepID=UPI0025D64C35|nr:nuclear transport factor 2 family protein [uncultured Sphingomonas sp.]